MSLRNTNSAANEASPQLARQQAADNPESRFHEDALRLSGIVPVFAGAFLGNDAGPAVAVVLPEFLAPRVRALTARNIVNRPRPTQATCARHGPALHREWRGSAQPHPACHARPGPAASSRSARSGACCTTHLCDGLKGEFPPALSRKGPTQTLVPEFSKVWRTGEIIFRRQPEALCAQREFFQHQPL